MWKHITKFKNQEFIGRYNRTKNDKERIFELVNTKSGRIITFESWQMAKSLGWVYAKNK